MQRARKSAFARDLQFFSWQRNWIQSAFEKTPRWAELRRQVRRIASTPSRQKQSGYSCNL